MSSEKCRYCDEKAENEETVWGTIFWCNSCEADAMWEIYSGVGRKIMEE
jgi:hypothetical protein